jgi:hypothetical protein
MKIKYLLVAAVAILTPAAAFAQTGINPIPEQQTPTTVDQSQHMFAPPCCQQPDVVVQSVQSRVVHERVYRAHVTWATASAAIEEARHQCRYILRDNPGSIAAARRVFIQRLGSRLAGSMAVYVQTGSRYAMFAANADLDRELASASTVVKCHKMLDHPAPAK